MEKKKTKKEKERKVREKVIKKEEKGGKKVVERKDDRIKPSLPLGEGNTNAVFALETRGVCVIAVEVEAHRIPAEHMVLCGDGWSNEHQQHQHATRRQDIHHHLISKVSST